jgi:hypothetical protein
MAQARAKRKTCQSCAMKEQNGAEYLPRFISEEVFSILCNASLFTFLVMITEISGEEFPRGFAESQPVY